ncbi:SDR family NAD(P)-dependent oxidoreductase [Nocardioides aquaticus]|nr:SDR family NAD(P)-dependent oxidoreductase [Nocardioides aquaticus]
MRSTAHSVRAEPRLSCRHRHRRFASAGQVKAAAAAAGDVQVLINNAGISIGSLLVAGGEATIGREMDTNFYGPLLMTRAFAAILGAHGGGAILNVVSALSWFTAPGAGA